jgi:hypothetical protein
MITARLCFAALAVVRDSESNSISAFNILEGLTAAGTPFLMQSVSFFALWQRELTDPPRASGTFTVAINDEELNRAAINVDFGGNTRNRTVVNVNGLVVPRPGSLRFRIVLETGARAEYAVDVVTLPTVPQVPT